MTDHASLPIAVSWRGVACEVSSRHLYGRPVLSSPGPVVC
jgi:hypothetical protein